MKKIEESELLGFKLISYENGSSSIKFYKNDESLEGAQISIIIGPNGSGKSRVLGELIDELVLIDELRYAATKDIKSASIRRVGKSKATITYRLGNNLCSIIRDGNKLTGSVNGSDIDFHMMPFPRKAFAVAHLPVDRFRFSKNERGDFYSYFGLRQATNLTTTGALEVKVLLSLVRGYERVEFQKNLQTWLTLLKLGELANIQIGGISPELLHAKSYENFLGVAIDIARRRIYNRAENIDDFKIKYNYQLDLSWLLFRRLAFERLQADGKKLKISIDITPSIFDDEHTPEFWESAFEAARSMRLLPDIGLYFKKNGMEIRFSDLSSGEQQILGTTTRLLAFLEPYSFVVIDEPEVSLHPSWQMRYVPT